MINMQFNIQESRKVKNFFGVYFEWDCDTNVLYAKKLLDKDVEKFVGGYENFIGSDIKVQKMSGGFGVTLSKSELE